MIRQLLSTCLVVCAVATMAAKKPIVGAIRWDGTFSQPGQPQFEDKNEGVVSRTVTYDLSLPKYHSRVPFFGKEINDTAIVANGNTSEVMGQELDYAASHGIDFWSFCNYPLSCKESHPPDSDCKGIQCCADNVGLSYAWNQYLAHPDNHKVNFTVLLQPGYWFPTALKGGDETFDKEIARYISYFKMPNYQKVLGGRPLVFLFGGQANETDLEILRKETKAALGVLPYITSMSGQKLASIDARSAYATGGGGPNGGSYVDLIAKKEVDEWTSWAKSGDKVIPTVSAGWDPRPRKDYPCPWMHPNGDYVTDPTMVELENHTADGLTWVKANPAAAEAGVVMLSAWNEHDEGHWISPALDKYGGKEKLEAVKRGIDKAAH
jgi:hypothetical protein